MTGVFLILFLLRICDSEQLFPILANNAPCLDEVLAVQMTAAKNPSSVIRAAA